MYKSGRRLALIGACSALALLASTGSAWAAKTVFVSNTAPLTEAGNDCEHPRFATVQGAIEAAAPATAIKVCPGTYSEQLTIDKSVKIIAAEGAETVTVKLPETVAVGTGGSCSLNPQGEQTEIAICTSGNVALTKLRIDARYPEGTCVNDLYGVYVAGGGKLTAKSDEIIGAGASPANHCFGTGVQVGSTPRNEALPSGAVGHARLVDCSVHEYVDTGIAAEGAGSSVAVTRTSVEAGGPGRHSPTGVKIREGATGSIKASTIAGNGRSGRASFGTGVELFRPTPPVTIYNDYIRENSRGLEFTSGAATQPTTPEVKIFRSHFILNEQVALLLEEGDALISYDVIEGSTVGIGIRQTASQPFAPNSSAAHDTIQGSGEAAIKVMSDDERSDPPGDFLIKSSFISNNPTEVIDNSENFTVTRLNDT
jgi:nitrous oxidase accessory protein NosD